MKEASTQLCAIFLHPAGHTRSPAMHNAAFAALGLDAIYLAFDVAPEALADALLGARALGIRQLAISIPHKSKVLAHLDEVEETARRIGAVNTVTRVGSRLVGANTDWLGAVRALERETELAGRRAVVLGAGGAARAVAFGLRQSGAEVVILNRSVERAEAVARDLDLDAAGPLSSLAGREYDVLVNTTPVGLREDRSLVDPLLLRPGAVVLDAVYDPAETRLLREAALRGARPVGGKWMLVEQALAQLRLWAGDAPDAEVLAKAFDDAASP